MSLKLLILLLAYVVASEGKPCRKTEFYQAPTQVNEKGICGKCPACPLGQEPDIKATRNRTVFGFLDCYTCKPCGENYYRDSGISKCYKCKKDCESGHRETQQKCGGANPGSCGDCFQGYFPFDKNDKESICIPAEEETPVETAAGPELKVEVKNVNAVHYNERQGLSGEMTAALIAVAALVLVVGAVALVVYRVLKNKGEMRRDIAREASSIAALLQTNNSVGSRLAVVDVVETDGPAPSDPRPELVEVVPLSDSDVSSEPKTDSATFVNTGPDDSLVNMQSMNFSVGKDSRGDPSGQSRQCPTVLPKAAIKKRLNKNSKELDLVASDISGERVLEVYRGLGIRKALYEPERDLWMEHKQSHKDHVLNVLIEWMKHDGADATLDKLCKALEIAGFHDTVGIVHEYLEEIESQAEKQIESELKTSKPDVEQGSTGEKPWPPLGLGELIDETDSTIGVSNT